MYGHLVILFVPAITVAGLSPATSVEPPSLVGRTETAITDNASLPSAFDQLSREAADLPAGFYLALADGQTEEQGRGPRTSARHDIDRELEARARQYTALVDAFYRYDVGLLRGIEGARVRAAWERLRDDAAIPAIVAGLNMAVRSGASCPIYAFAEKLNDLLARSEHPEMGAYVLRHLNRSARTPYSSVLRSVEHAAQRQLMRAKSRAYARKSLLDRMRRPSDERTVVSGTASLLDLLGESPTGAEQDGGRSHQSAESHANAPTGALVRRLAGGNASVEELKELERRAAGAEAGELLQHRKVLLVAASASSLPASHRVTAIRILARLRVREAVPVLIDVLEDGPTALRNEAAMALTRITRKLFGPPPGAAPEEVRQAVERWRAWWKSEQASIKDGSP